MKRGWPQAGFTADLLPISPNSSEKSVASVKLFLAPRMNPPNLVLPVPLCSADCLYRKSLCLRLSV